MSCCPSRWFPTFAKDAKDGHPSVMVLWSLALWLQENTKDYGEYFHANG
jgi:hypothetical protein